MSASRIVFPEDSSNDGDFSHTVDGMMDGWLMEGESSEQMKSNNRCDDGDKNADERVCPHCDIAFNDTMALQEHLYEIIEKNSKKKNIDGSMDDSADSGSEDTGSEDTDSEDTGSEDTGSEDTGSEDTGSQDTDNANLENKNEKMPKKSKFSNVKRSINTERKRISEDHDTSSGKGRRTTQDREESLLKELLYRCNLCEVYFVSKKKALTHFESCRSGAITIQPVNCVKCGRPFEPKELVTHSVRDYRHSEVKLKIFNISPVPERQPPKGTPSEKKQDSAPKREKVPLFKCQKCDAHFVTTSGLRTHEHRDRHDMELIQCEICDFSFTSRSHNVHIIEHHDRLGLRRQDFEVVANNVPDPSRSRRTRDTASESNSSDITEKKTSESNNDWSPKKKDRELPPVMKTLQKPKTKSYTKKMGTTHPVARATTTKYGPSEDVLYKCGEKRCGLFFTTSRGLKEHVSKELHEADLKLQCKFCKNYFSENSLSYHLKHHHIEKRDNIDDIVSIFSLDISNFITEDSHEGRLA